MKPWYDQYKALKRAMFGPKDRLTPIKRIVSDPRRLTKKQEKELIGVALNRHHNTDEWKEVNVS